ncbi:MAG TPA: hypothetical protein VMM27_04270, partial [Casimicrobiaceae bacterium]|nr:hypothetical protein [Casimicrobiaceae bacterium]
NPAWWREERGLANQQVLLDLVFGEGTLRTKPGQGIIMHRDGSWEIKAATPILDDAALRTLVAKVTPGRVRPKLLKQQMASTARPRH